jgi:CheY-like chemotaxis protein
MKFLPKGRGISLYTRERPTDIGLRHAILVVEDNRDGRESLKQLLEALGHMVQVAETGPEGVRLALEFEPDLAIIDIGLPGFDGFEVARRIRRTLGTGVRLIANTGYDSPFFRHQAESAGFDEYTVKPALALELRRWLG